MPPIKLLPLFFGLILSLILSILTASPRALGQSRGTKKLPTVSGLCSADGEVLIARSGTKAGDSASTVLICELVTGLAGPEPRLLSRAETAALYNHSRSEITDKDAHAKVWADLGIKSSADLQKKMTDSEVSSELMITLKSNEEEAADQAAKWLAQLSGSPKPVRIVQVDDSNSRKLNSAYLRSFAANCENHGGSFSIPTAQLMAEENPTLTGKVVCSCQDIPFSNPVDYTCNRKGPKKFYEIESPTRRVKEQTNGIRAGHTQN